MKSPLSIFVAALLPLLLAGCGGGDPAQRSFDVRGVIREIPPDRQTATIRHEEIPGYMPKMTMQLTVRDTNELVGLAAGDEITFKLHATTNTHWIDAIRKVGASRAAGEEAPSRNAAFGSSNQLKPGDALPEVELVSETGEALTLSSLKGRVVVFTFIFTRCPLPDFCPLMNRNFANARKLLLADKSGPTNWQFLSISFDSEFDRPEVLARYAENYRAEEKDRWLFAAASRATLDTIAPRLNLIVTAEGGSFSHNLRTVVLDPQGRIFRQLDSNKWTADELADAVRAAAAAKPAP